MNALSYKIIAIIIVLAIIGLYAYAFKNNNNTQQLPPLEEKKYVGGVAYSNSNGVTVGNGVATSDSPLMCLDATGGSHPCTEKELIGMGFEEVK